MYITVDKKDKFKSLVVTSKEKDAEVFSLKALGDDTAHHKFEFSLASPLHKYRDYQAQSAGTSPQLDESQASSSSTPTKENASEDKATSQKTDKSQASSSAEDKGKKQLPLEYYLETVVNPLRGKDSITPRMRMNCNSKNIRMLLKKRVNPQIACDTKQWRKGREAYFIQCIHPFRSGFLCVKKKSNSDDYKVCVRPLVHSHCDDSEIFMLFRLKSATEFIGVPNSLMV